MQINIKSTKRRVKRFQAERPNQLHHVDATSSKFLYIKRELGDGELIGVYPAGFSVPESADVYELFLPL